jgi:hypothetical protein
MKLNRNSKINKKFTIKKINKTLMYKIIYKSMAIIFFILFTMIFVTSLVGDIKSKQNVNPSDS